MSKDHTDFLHIYYNLKEKGQVDLALFCFLHSPFLLLPCLFY